MFSAALSPAKAELRLNHCFELKSVDEIAMRMNVKGRWRRFTRTTQACIFHIRLTS